MQCNDTKKSKIAALKKLYFRERSFQSHLNNKNVFLQIITLGNLISRLFENLISQETQWRAASVLPQTDKNGGLKTTNLSTKIL